MKTIPKRSIAVLSILLCLFIVAVFLSGYFYREGRFGGAFRFRRPNFSILTENGENYLDSPGSFDGSSASLRLQNGENEPLSITLLSEGEVLFESTLLPDEQKEVTLSPQKKLSVFIKGEENTSFIFDQNTILNFSEELSGDIYFSGVEMDKVSFCAPVRLFGLFDFNEISIETEEKGNVVISPDLPSDGKVFVRSPNAKVFAEKLNVSKQSLDFYVKAKSFNGKHLSAESFPIEDFDSLSRLFSENALPRLTEDAEILFLSPFEMEASFETDLHVSLEFVSNVTFGEYTLTMANNKKGEYRVKTHFGTAPDAASLLFLSPKSTLVWEGENGSAVPVLSTVEKYSNLSYYNGVKTTLGGEGVSMPTVTFPAKENDFLTKDAVFEAKGNLLLGNLPFSVNEKDLADAVYTLKTSEGEVRVEGAFPDGLIHTTDETGKTHTFALSVRREKNHIPVLYLETEGREDVTSKSQYLSATFELDGEGTATSSQKETHIRLRGRGNSTWKWDKKPYKIHFDEPTSILGLPAAEEWALFANYADKSLMRNRLAQVMAETLSFEYCPTQEYVDLFLNGEYLGVYGIGEHLEAGEGRVEVSHNMSKLDCGYYLEAGGVVSGVDVKGMNYFHAGLVKFVLIKDPEYNMLTSEQFDYIKNYMLKADAAVKKGDGYEAYLDMETLIDWLIMIEVTNNTDCAWRRSTYFTKEPGGKLKMGPVWDFDLAFGNFSKDVAGFNTWVSTSEDDYVGETWSTHLLEDPEFQQTFKARWDEVKENLLNTALASIDADYELLAPSAKENFDRWEILGKKVAFERHDTKNYKTYDSQIEYLKNFLENRFAWIDSQVEAW